MASPSRSPLPECLDFLDEPYLKIGDEYVKAAEISSIREEDVTGSTRSYTITVPIRRLARAHRTPARTGWRMEVSEGSFEATEETRGFRITAPSGDRYEPLVVGWTNHNRTVVSPAIRFLSSFGLVPELIFDDSRYVVWHDLDGPTYSVVKVWPVAKHEGPDECTTARVDILRSYLERYAIEQRSAVVSVYYEQRSLRFDAELESRLGSQDGIYIETPGRTVEIKRIHGSEFPYFAAIWGTRLVLKPDATSAQEERKPSLEWPGFAGVVTPRRAWMLNMSDRIYVRDEVLAAYEDRDEFDVDPTDGSVGYDGRWALSYSNAVGRDYFAYELKKIYEGCPADVIEHVHKFAVEPEISLKQRENLGNENIGTRAAKLVATFYAVVDAIHSVATVIGVPLEVGSIAKPTKERANYYGWWTLDDLKTLGYRAPQTMTKSDFLHRCATVAKFLERIKEAPLRKILLAMGMPKEEVQTRKTMQLLGVFAVLAELAEETGMNFSEDAANLVERWNANLRVDSVNSLLALRDLREIASHPTAEGVKKRMTDDLLVFDIDPAAAKQGWGFAVDRVYDVTAASLSAIASAMRNATA